MLNLTGNELATIRAMLNRPQLSVADLRNRLLHVRMAIIACQLYQHESTHHGVLSIDISNLLYKLYPDMWPALEMNVHNALRESGLIREFRFADTTIVIVTLTSQLNKALRIQAVDPEALQRTVEALERYRENGEDAAMLADVAGIIRAWGVSGAKRLALLLQGATDPLFDSELDDGDEVPADKS